MPQMSRIDRVREGAGSVEEFLDEAPRSLRGMQKDMRQLKEEWS